MRPCLAAAVALLLGASAAHARGLLIPEEKSLPPLAMLDHKVAIAIEDQVAVTRVEQTFRNHTSRPLEATYVFPVPRGASVNKFTMWVNGKETKGEVVEAGKARSIYEGIVRRTQDPGLLEYLDSGLLRLRVFPIPAHGDQKVAVRYTSVSPREGNLVEYIYPLKSDARAARTLEAFAITATIKSQHPVVNVYSPSHDVTLKRKSDRAVEVRFERNAGILDRDFQLFYSTSDKDVGLTALAHRPVAADRGWVSLLISPSMHAVQKYQVPRDVVLVLDTSGSMRQGGKIEQARKALKFCLENLGAKDRFGLVSFATTVNRYEDRLLDASPDQRARAVKWVDDLEATGGTAIQDALASALELRTGDMGRPFTVVFFTDGLPTIGETDAQKIVKNFEARNTANTRVFTFGVGDDVNATMLDQLAERSRALSTYVRPAEDISTKVAGLYGKISNPVLTNLKLTTTGDVRLADVFPPQLPDLFHGGQLVVMARYAGQGPSAIKLTGRVGAETKEFVYEMTFPEKTGGERDFVEHLWARRKVGYLLDQIRANGAKKELVEEVTTLAKRYGITTPYTSYLIVPDGPVPLPAVRRPIPGGRPDVSFGPVTAATTVPPGLAPAAPTDAPVPVAEFARRNQTKPGELATNRGRLTDDELKKGARAFGLGGGAGPGKTVTEARDKKDAYDRARELLSRREKDAVQAGKLGVDLSVHMQKLREQARLERTALRQAYGRNCLEIGGVWIDEGFDAKMPTLVVRAQSDAYFQLLRRQPRLREVFQLGNHLVWVTPNHTALVIDAANGKDKLTDAEMDRLFVRK